MQATAVGHLDRLGFWEQAHNAIKRAAAGEEVDAFAELAALNAAREAVAKDLKRRKGAALVKPDASASKEEWRRYDKRSEARGLLMFMAEEIPRLSEEDFKELAPLVKKLRGRLEGVIHPYPETEEETD